MNRPLQAEVEASQVGVVVLNWGDAPFLEQCLVDVFGQQGDFSLYLVVVDNETTAQSRATISTWLHQNLGERAGNVVSASLIGCEDNLGYAGGMNRGIEFLGRQCGIDYFWLLNNDVRLARDALAELLAAGRQNPGCGILGSVITGEGAAGGAGVFGGYCYSPITSRIRACREASQRPDYIAGAAMLVRAAVFDTVGPLSERFFLYCEELDLALRARRAGWALACAARSRVWHDSGRSIGRRSPLAGRSPDWAREYFENRSILRLTARHFPARLPVVVVVRLLAKGFLGLARRRRHFGALLLALRDFAGGGPARSGSSTEVFFNKQRQRSNKKGHE